jgi:hypothetical protein
MIDRSDPNIVTWSETGGNFVSRTLRSLLLAFFPSISSTPTSPPLRGNSHEYNRRITTLSAEYDRGVRPLSDARAANLGQAWRIHHYGEHTTRSRRHP